MSSLIHDFYRMQIITDSCESRYSCILFMLFAWFMGVDWRLRAGGEGDNRGWDGWMASPTWWTWVWVSSESWWWTRRPGVLQSMGSQSLTRLSDFSSLSAQYRCSVMSDSLLCHRMQHNRPPCPSPTPRAYSNSCPLSWWCHPTISSSVVLFFSCLQSFPALGSFQMSQFFASGGQSIGVSASASVFPINVQDWSPLGMTGLISSNSLRVFIILRGST